MDCYKTDQRDLPDAGPQCYLAVGGGREFFVLARKLTPCPSVADFHDRGVGERTFDRDQPVAPSRAALERCADLILIALQPSSTLPGVNDVHAGPLRRRFLMDQAQG